MFPDCFDCDREAHYLVLVPARHRDGARSWEETPLCLGCLPSGEDWPMHVLRADHRRPEDTDAQVVLNYATHWTTTLRVGGEA